MNLDADCTTDESCVFSFGTCGGEGSCRPTGNMCAQYWDPVCGCNGVTYTNDCSAVSSGVSAAHAGACEEASCTDAQCDDNDPCTAESCDQVSGCTYAPVEACVASVPAASNPLRAVVALFLAGAGIAILSQIRPVGTRE